MSVDIIIAGIALVAFVVSCITQATKEIGFLAKIPTTVQVLVLSVILTPVTYLVYANMNDIAVEWTQVLISVVCGFITTLVATQGWQFVKDLWDRNHNSDKSDGSNV